MTRRSAVPPPVTAVLDASSTWLPARLGEVEELLRAQAAGHGELLAADARATLDAGGKRLRPLLVLLCAGPDAGEAAVRAAAAVELVHMATLVHDDVLDAAPLRRGQPTVAAASGREPRGRAPATCSSPAPSPCWPTAGEARAIELLASASVALARGELAQRQDAYDTSISEERYLERCRLKTAALFECACLIGPGERRGSGGSRSSVVAVGLAFQLLDDVLDVAGPAERTGKARGTDLLDGTVTLPLILAAEADPELLATDLRSLDAGGRRGAVRPDRRRRGSRPGPRAGAGDGRRSQARGSRPAGLDAEQRRLLEPGRRRRRPALQLSCRLRVAEVVGGEEVGLERRREGVGDVLHVLALELLEDPAQRLGAGVELLVVGVDLTLAVDGVAVPAALRAAPPEAPVAAVARPAPSGSAGRGPSRTRRRRAARRASPGLGGRLWWSWCGLCRPYLSIEPAKLRINPHFFDKKRRNPTSG